MLFIEDIERLLIALYSDLPLAVGTLYLVDDAVGAGVLTGIEVRRVVERNDVCRFVEDKRCTVWA